MGKALHRETQGLVLRFITPIDVMMKDATTKVRHYHGQGERVGGRCLSCTDACFKTKDNEAITPFSFSCPVFAHSNRAKKTTLNVCDVQKCAKIVQKCAKMCKNVQKCAINV